MHESDFSPEQTAELVAEGFEATWLVNLEVGDEVAFIEYQGFDRDTYVSRYELLKAEVTSVLKTKDESITEEGDVLKLFRVSFIVDVDGLPQHKNYEMSREVFIKREGGLFSAEQQETEQELVDAEVPEELFEVGIFEK